MPKQTLEDLITLRPKSEYNDDDGFVLWWHVPIEEPPIVDNGDVPSGIENDWFTHWSPLPYNPQVKK